MGMIKEFDNLTIKSDEYERLSESEKRERVRKREELLSKMSKEELNELLKRPYPSQMKEKIKKYL